MTDRDHLEMMGVAEAEAHAAMRQRTRVDAASGAALPPENPVPLRRSLT
jgi:hypothetical protein